MANLRDFSKQNIETDSKDKAPDPILDNEDFQKTKDQYGGLVEEFLSRYGKMDESQLLSEMMKLIAQKKREGTFDANQIRKAAEHIAPMLSDEQRAKMYSLLNYLD